MVSCREQCSCRGLGFGGVSALRFVLPQARWPLLPWSFIAYRVMLAVYQLTYQILIFFYWGEPPLYDTQTDSKLKWFIFLSNWTYFTLTLYLVWSAGTTIFYHIAHRNEVNAVQDNNGMQMKPASSTNPIVPADDADGSARKVLTPWYLQLSWLLRVIACSAELYVTSLYWILEYSPGSSVNVFSIHVHGVGVCLMIVDTFLVATPTRILHFIYCSIYFLCFYIFSFIYYIAGGLNTRGGLLYMEAI